LTIDVFIYPPEYLAGNQTIVAPWARDSLFNKQFPDLFSFRLVQRDPFAAGADRIA